MKARYQYRFYPTDQQKQRLAQLFGCVRVVWNDALAFCRSMDKYPGIITLLKMLTEAKQTVERAWLKDVSSVPLQQALRHLDKAYNNFFNSRNGKHKGGQRGFPRFKRRSNQQSAEFARTAFSVVDGEVLLAKVGMLFPIWSRSLPSEPSSVTVIKDCAHRYFLSFVVELLPIHLPAASPAVGVDLGLKTFAVLSTGEPVESPDYSDIDRRVRQLQRKLARQSKGSNRWKRTSVLSTFSFRVNPVGIYPKTKL